MINNVCRNSLFDLKFATQSLSYTIYKRLALVPEEGQLRILTSNVLSIAALYT